MGFLRGISNFLTGGTIDRLEANRITQAARCREDEARDNLENQKIKTQNRLEHLGLLKQHIFENSLQQFISIYQTVGKVDLSPIKKLDGALTYDQFKVEYIEMKKISTTFKELAIVSGGGVVAGAAAVGGALGIAALIGTASTGTAIGSLSGIAATNATLAWLGGGAISAGGAGMAGGMVVLGGIALAPVAILGMFLGANKGKQKLNHAQNYSNQVDVLVEKIQTLILELQKIERGAEIFENTIICLDQLMLYQNNQMQTIITRLNNRNVFNKYLIDPLKKFLKIQILTQEEATIFRDTANTAHLLKQIIDTPIIDDEGAFLEDAIIKLQKEQHNCNSLLRQANLPQLTIQESLWISSE